MYGYEYIYISNNFQVKYNIQIYYFKIYTFDYKIMIFSFWINLTKVFFLLKLCPYNMNTLKRVIN